MINTLLHTFSRGILRSVRQAAFETLRVSLGRMMVILIRRYARATSKQAKTYFVVGNRARLEAIAQ